MTHPDTSTLPNTLRRRLLLALPGGLVMATPLAMVACGGGDAGVETPAVDAAAGVPLGADAGIAATSMRLAVQWPSGAARPAGTMRVAGTLGSADVSGDAADIEILGDGPDLVTLYSADDKALLIGFVGKGATVLSPLSTVSVLMHYALGLNFANAAPTAAVQAYLAATPQVAALADTFAALLAANPLALHSAAPALGAAIAATCSALVKPSAGPGSGRAQALGLTVEPVLPTGPGSGTIGLSVEQGSEFNTVFVRNAGMRRAVFEIRQEGWYDDKGEFHADQRIVAADEVPLPKSFDSFGGTLAGWAESYWGGANAWGGEGEFFQSQTPPQALAVTPDAAKKTKYTVFVFTPGINHLPDAEYARLRTEELDYIRGGDLSKNLHWRVLLEDFAVPFLLGLLSGAAKDEVKGAYKDLVAGLVATVGGFIKDRMPDLSTQLGEGKLSVWDAFVQFAKTMTIDPVTLEMSPALKALLALVVKVIALRLKGETGRSLYRLVQSGGKRGASIFPVLKILESIDGFLGGAAKARLVVDSVVPYEFFAWEVMATKAKVVLTPKPLEVDALGGRLIVTVNVVDNDNDGGKEVGPITFDWVCTGKYGTLHKRAADGGATTEENVFTSSRDAPTHEYIANGEDKSAANDETISVTAFYGGVNTRGRTRIGSFTGPVKFKKPFSLRITPTAMDLPVDERLSLVASLVEPLPQTASIRYEWKLRSGGGDLNITLSDGDTAHSQVDYLAPASETVAIVEVVAVITTDPAVLPFRTDPVTSTIAVKKGLRKIVMEVTGGSFSCYDPKACGVSQYGAFIVPRLAKATGYEAVLSGFGYPGCNRTVKWTSVQRDYGDCNFPVSYYPHTSAGATNLWAVWTSFGGAPEGKCIVTITLAA